MNQDDFFQTLFNVVFDLCSLCISHYNNKMILVMVGFSFFSIVFHEKRKRTHNDASSIHMYLEHKYVQISMLFSFPSTIIFILFTVLSLMHPYDYLDQDYLKHYHYFLYYLYFNLLFIIINTIIIIIVTTIGTKI